MGKFFDRVDITWSWGRPKYLIQWASRKIDVQVQAPTWKQKANGQIYEFCWIDGSVWKALMDETSGCAWILQEETTRANVSAHPDLFPRDAAENHRKESRTLNETMMLTTQTWQGFTTGRYRVRNRSGRSLSFQQILSCRLGGPSSTMLLRRELEADDEATLIAIGVCLTAMFGSVESPWG